MTVMRTVRSPRRAAPPRVELLRAAVPRPVRDAALRRIHTDLLQRGADAGELGRWLWGMHWFPHLVWSPEILAVANALPARLRYGLPCDPQILLHFPHTGPEPPVTFHRDREPEWAAGRRYLRIVGVALSPWTARNGGLVVKRRSRPQALTLAAGDAVSLHPDVLHSGGINRTGEIRYGVYFRWLSEPGGGQSEG